MSYTDDVPAAAWYPDPQTPGQVRWWDGTNWTEHVSRPAQNTEAARDLTERPETAAADAELATVSYIGRHAAGATPAPRQPATAPRIRPRTRVEVDSESLSYA